MAQLVAHHTGSVGVRGSSPLSSTFVVSRVIINESRDCSSEPRPSAGVSLRVAPVAVAWIDGVDADVLASSRVDDLDGSGVQED